MISVRPMRLFMKYLLRCRVRCAQAYHYAAVREGL